ncbi:MAG: putative metal-binding motif-containing protein [Saprospiraceae bacterium]|nr:putative metal-binding motif-containing protein [Saprospiraceae bacterium]
MTNNRIIVERTVGTACENLPMADALDVTSLAGFNVVGWYTDAGCNTSAGTYNEMDNTFTPNDDAVGLTDFFVKISGGSCEYIFKKVITGSVLDGVVLYEDADSDGYGNPNVSTNGCLPAPGYSVNSGDCDDNDPLEFPNQEWFEDEDDDGYGHGPATVQCERPGSDWYLSSELIATGGDCDDNDPLEFPGQTWYKDHDGDDYSDGTSLVTCNRPPDYYIASELIATTGDCNDINPFEYPGQTWYLDNDGDDYSNGTNLVQCEYPGAGWYRATQLIATSGDCDDNDPLEFPGQTWHLDNDGDAYSNGTSITQCLRPVGNYFPGISSGDCNDADPTINPGEQDLCDNIDNNCNGITDEAPCGSTCALAKEIVALPFVYNGTTENAGNDYDDDDGCQHTWMTAEDYVFTYTPLVDQVARIKLTNTGNSPTGYYTHAVFVLNYCPDASGACLYTAWHPTNGQNAPIYIETMELQGGTTYYIMLDNHGTFHPNFSFTFEMDLPEGNICSNAIPLTPNSTVSGTTHLLGNDYGWADACNSDWMTGNDVVYEYTATAGEVARIKLEYDAPTPASGYYAPSVFVLNGCPDDAGANCLYAGFYVNSSNSPIWIETVQFPSAGTYYIVVASHGTFNPWYDFTLTIDNPLGNICENAVPISSLPHAASNQTTCLFGNEYSFDDACTSSWLTGNDFVYALTADMTGMIDITLSNLNDDYGSILFLNGCPNDPGASCQIAITNGTGNFSLENQPVTMGNTYYVVVSSHGTFTSCFNFDIGITSEPLPVELVSFSVDKQGKNTALLRWETASEVDFSHYEIERSTDGIAWSSIGQTVAHGGTEPAAYSYAARSAA